MVRTQPIMPGYFGFVINLNCFAIGLAENSLTRMFGRDIERSIVTVLYNSELT